MIFHGNYLDVDIYPVWGDYRLRGSRRKKAKPTSETQHLLNEKYARQKVVYLVNENFGKGDYVLHLTYDNAHIPNSFEDAIRDVKNFIRRIKRALKKLGIELKYFAVVEESSQKKRLHHHLIISGGLPITVIDALWGKGIVTTSALKFDEFGVSALSNYITKEKGGRKKIFHSRNLMPPRENQRDGCISRKKVKELNRYDCDPKEICKKLYPGYAFADMKTVNNQFNRQIYTTLRLYKQDIFEKKKKVNQIGNQLERRGVSGVSKSAVTAKKEKIQV